MILAAVKCATRADVRDLLPHIYWCAIVLIGTISALAAFVVARSRV